MALHGVRRRVGPASERPRRGRRGLGPHRRPAARRRARRRRRPRCGRRVQGVAEGESRQGGRAAGGRGGRPQVGLHRRRGRRRRRHRLLHRRVAQARPGALYAGRARGAAARQAHELRPVHAAHDGARPRPLLPQRRRRLAGPGLPHLLRDCDEEVLQVPHQRRQERQHREVHRQPAGIPRQHPVRRRRTLLDRTIRGKDAPVGHSHEAPVRPEAGVRGRQVCDGAAEPEQRGGDERDAGGGAGVHVQRPGPRPRHRLAQDRQVPLLRVAGQSVHQQDRPDKIFD